MKILLSPPFGSRFNPSWATRVMGTYTISARKGLIWRTLKTLRKTDGGWVNAIGLRNPGIFSIRTDKFSERSVYSIAAINAGDYQVFLAAIPAWATVEINLSCPNLHSVPVFETSIQHFPKRFATTIVKLPPPCVDHAYHWAEKCYEYGIRYFHACNTIPTQQGGESGNRLRPQSLKMIRWLHKNFSDVKIIGGGGIYSPEHVREYRDAGAEFFSLSTVCFTPWKLPAIIEEINR